jgi:hypothetical protein
MSCLILPYADPSPTQLPLYYSIFEGGSLGEGYIIGGLVVTAKFTRINTLAYGTFCAWRVEYFGHFASRDVARYTTWASVPQDNEAAVLTDLFHWLHCYQKSAGPFYAVRVSTLPIL